ANYLPSLLTEAARVGRLDARGEAAARERLTPLLEQRLRRFTSDQSSSVAADRAEQLFGSALYTVGIALQRDPLPERQLERYLTEDSLLLYEQGLLLLREMLDEAKAQMVRLRETELPLKNAAYHDTILELPNFFRAYDVEYSAQETIVAIDYPLAEDPMNQVGVQYLLTYLRKLNFENSVCARFTPEALQRLTECYHPGFEQLLENMYRLVLANLIGCLLAGREPRALALDAADFPVISDLLRKNASAQEKITVAARAAFSVQASDEPYFLRTVETAFAHLQECEASGRLSAALVQVHACPF
ncbi:MAG: DUF6179 domain-containing protein, partial [Oscillospiraceae bacterium]